jgi:hypothetical protein
MTLTVTDNGTPVRSAARNFTIIVRDRRTDFGLAVGSTNLFHGESNAVPLSLTSEVELSELTFLLNQEGGTLGGLALGTLAPEISSALLEPFGPAGSRLHFQFAGLDRVNNYLLGQLRFFAPSNAPSALIALNPSDAAALDYGDSILTRAQLTPGRVVVVNREPVLTMHRGPAPTVTLFGRPGASYTIEYESTLATPGDWQPLTGVTLIGRFAGFELNGLGPIGFLRARETSPGPGLRYDSGTPGSGPK